MLQEFSILPPAALPYICVPKLTSPRELVKERKNTQFSVSSTNDSKLKLYSIRNSEQQTSVLEEQRNCYKAFSVLTLRQQPFRQKHQEHLENVQL